MTDLDFFEKVLARVERNEHTEFQLLTQYAQYVGLLKVHNAICDYLHSLKKNSDKLFADYLKEVKTGNQEFGELIAFQKLRECVRFFDGEREIMLAMIKEYEAYILRGHRVLAQWLFGAERSEEEMYDFRKRP